FLVDRPAILPGQPRRITRKKLSRFRIALELPLEPCDRSHRPVAAVGLSECSTVADTFIGNEDRKLFDALEIVHAVGVRNVRLSAQEEKDRGVKFRKVVLRERGHAGQIAAARTASPRAARCGGWCATG